MKEYKLKPRIVMAMQYTKDTQESELVGEGIEVHNAGGEDYRFMRLPCRSSSERIYYTNWIVYDLEVDMYYVMSHAEFDSNLL